MAAAHTWVRVRWPKRRIWKDSGPGNRKLWKTSIWQQRKEGQIGREERAEEKVLEKAGTQMVREKYYKAKGNDPSGQREDGVKGENESAQIIFRKATSAK